MNDDLLYFIGLLWSGRLVAYTIIGLQIIENLSNRREFRRYEQRRLAYSRKRLAAIRNLTE